MPARYQILTPLNLVYVEVSGKVTLKEISRALENYVADTGFDPRHRQLIDLRLMTDSLTLVWEMTQYKKLYDTLYDDLSKPISAALITSSPFGKRLAWMYSKVMQDRQTLQLEVFDNISSALDNFDIGKESFAQQLQNMAIREKQI